MREDLPVPVPSPHVELRFDAFVDGKSAVGLAGLLLHSLDGFWPVLDRASVDADLAHLAGGFRP